MNRNHSHFIFVDSGESKYGGEIEFRTKLETRIKSEKGIPLVLIVLGGGKNTLETIVGALDNESPVILITVCILIFILKF